jgi:hypothetical protein
VHQIERGRHTGIPTYAQVHYQDVYPGIDLVYYGSAQGQLEDDFVVAPGSDPGTIQLAVDRSNSLDLDATGALVVSMPGGELRLQPPAAYQETNGTRQPIPAAYTLSDEQQVGFAVGAYDASRPLIIDPVLVYATFLGGSDVDDGTAIAVDGAGNAYIAGFTSSTDFPATPAVVQRKLSSLESALVSKLNASGTVLVYSTFLGGSGQNIGKGIAVDGGGNAYITGRTTSADFPTSPGAFQTSMKASVNAFVSKLNPPGTTLVYSTFLGGSGIGGDAANSVAVDAAGDAIVVGAAGTADFPTTPGAFQRTFGGGVADAFVAKISPGPPACEGAALLPGPPAQLRVLVHADRGLASLATTEASNASVALPSFPPGSTDTFLVTATKFDQSAGSTFTIRATDQTAASTESHVTITNGTPGVDRVRLVVNGHPFQVTGLNDRQQRTVDVSSAMRKGSDNTILVVAQGPRNSSAVVIVTDS